MLTMLLALALLQDDPARLVERLRSDDLAERDESSKKLRAMGAPALKALAPALKDADADVASRAKRLVAVIEIDIALTPAFRAEFPDAADRLAGAGDEEWTKLFLEATARDDKERKRHASLGPKDVEPLAVRAARGAKLDRERVFRACVRWRLRRAAAEMVEYLFRSDSPGPCASMLRQLYVREAAPRVVAMLRSPGRWPEEAPGNIAAALEVLRALGCPPGAEERSILRALLSNEWHPGRLLALRALLAQQDRDAIPEIAKRLDDTDDSVRHLALDVVAQFDAREHVDKVAALCDHVSADTRAHALACWSRLGGASTEPRIRERLAGDSDAYVRAVAAHALRDLARPESVPALVAALRDTDAGVQHEAASALAHIGGPKALEALATLAGHDELARLAFPALWAAQDPRALAVLEKLLRSGKLLDSESAFEVLREQRPASARPVVERVIRSAPAHVRRRALDGLVILGGEGVAKVVAESLKDPDGDVRLRAAGLLGTFDDKAFVPDFVALLEDDDAGVRMQAIDSLRNLRARDAVGKVVPLLKHAAPVSWSAAEMIGLLGGDGEVAPLRGAIAVEENRIHAAEALARLGDRSGVATLIEHSELMPRRLFPLNRLRKPEAWKRLQKPHATLDLRGTRRELLEVLAREGGVKLALDPSDIQEELDDWLAKKDTLDSWGGRDTTVGSIEALARFDERYLVILEDDAIRVAQRDAAIDFWTKWAK